MDYFGSGWVRPQTPHFPFPRSLVSLSPFLPFPCPFGFIHETVLSPTVLALPNPAIAMANRDPTTFHIMDEIFSLLVLAPFQLGSSWVPVPIYTTRGRPLPHLSCHNAYLSHPPLLPSTRAMACCLCPFPQLYYHLEFFKQAILLASLPFTPLHPRLCLTPKLLPSAGPGGQA